MNGAGSAWERVKDARGRVFYVNHVTREVRGLSFHVCDEGACAHWRC